MTEQTLVFIKPDGVRRHIVGDVISRFEKKGLKLAALKMKSLTQAQSDAHYHEHVSKAFYASLREFITSGPVVLMVLEGENAIDVVRLMVGETDGQKAASGTIRGDFAMSKAENIIHASDSSESAKREISHFWPHGLR